MCYAIIELLFFCTAAYYLVYFDNDKTVSVVSASVISKAELEVGGSCHVTVKGKFYEGRIVTYGELL